MQTAENPLTPSNSSSSAIPQPTPTVLRVRRKRGADPYEAFVVSLKKPRKNHGSDPNADGKTPLAILYSFTGTSSTPDVSGIDGLPSYAKVIDFQPPHLDDTAMLVLNNESNETSAAANDSDAQQYLNTFSNAIGEGSADKENIATTTTSKEAQITVNGEPMISVKESVLPIEADYVFDFYWNPMGIISDPDTLHIRLANKDDIEFYCGEDTESSAAADDEDDSNDENNWRNDYPDEESHSSESSEEHYYDDMVKQFDDYGFDDETDDGSD